MLITFYHPRMTLEHLGLLPSFIDEGDQRSLKEQFNENYISGWRTMSNVTLLDGRTLHYPGDPLMEPLARIDFQGRDEYVLFYEHEIVAIIQPDGSCETCRMN